MGTAPHTRPTSTPPAGWVPSPAMAGWLASQPATGDGGLPCLFPDDVAAVTVLAGAPLAVVSVHRANYSGKKHRRLRQPPLPSDLPAPAGHRSRPRDWPKRSGPPSPYWWPWDIDAWQAGRRGPGNPTGTNAYTRSRTRRSRRTTRSTLTEGAQHDPRHKAAS